MPHLIHYLENYFLAGPPADPACAGHLEDFLRVAAQLGVHVAMEKVEGPTTILTFLGLQLDSTAQVIRLPPKTEGTMSGATPVVGKTLHHQTGVAIVDQEALICSTGSPI